MSAPRDRVLASFGRAFGGKPDLLVQAPGRVNLIGEHTDYNDGLVLPCAIDFATVVGARRRSDGRIHVVASDFADDTDQFEIATDLAHVDGWAEYVRASAHVLASRGIQLGGADLAIAGNVPQGAGLSSSASLLVALIETFRRLNAIAGMSASDVAVTARAAENEFVGVQCGIMDQLISARGVAGHALLIDCRTLVATPIPVRDGLVVLIVHSGIERGLVGSQYNRRREECGRAARHYGVPALRDVDAVTLEAGRAGLDDVAFRRARHIVTENARVVDTGGALASGDTAALARLMGASHASMRDDFEITTPGIDRLVAIVGDAIGTSGGVRMTGGGFGGCIVAVLGLDAVKTALASVERDYRTPSGAQAAHYVCRASGGAGMIEAG